MIKAGGGSIINTLDLQVTPYGLHMVPPKLV